MTKQLTNVPTNNTVIVEPQRVITCYSPVNPTRISTFISVVYQWGEYHYTLTQYDGYGDSVTCAIITRKDVLYVLKTFKPISVTRVSSIKAVYGTSNSSLYIKLT